MKSYIPHFLMLKEKSFNQTLEKLSTGPGIIPFAGGTDLMVLFEAGKLAEGTFLDISHLKELAGIYEHKDFLEIRALTTYSEIKNHPIVRREFPLLYEAAKVVGARAIQNRATIGGNIANASPAADGPPALLCYDAIIEIAAAKKNRKVPYCDFHKNYKVMDLKMGELIKAVWLRRSKSFTGVKKEFYHKVGTRKAQAISKVCFAAKVQLSQGQVQEIRLAYGSMAPYPVRAKSTERILQGEKLSSNLIQLAITQLQKDLSPIDDIRSTAKYRMQVACNLLKQFLEGCL